MGIANIAAWLLALAWPLAKKVLTMLGIGWLTYEGITTLTNNAIQAAQSNWGQMTGATLQLASLGGIPDMMGIICGAIVARAALIAVGRLGKVA
jgi:hypothetical protein